MELRNIAAYQVNKNTLGVIDADYTSFALQDVSIPKKWAGTGEQLSEELQLSGTASGTHLKWTVGGYFEYDRPTDTPEFDVAELAAVAPGEYLPIKVVVQGATTQRSRAVYGQTVYDFGGLSQSLQDVRLTTGLRYTWDTATESSSIYIPTFGNVCVFTAGTAPECLLSPSGSWSAPTWTVALDDQLTPQLLAYVTTRRGYKSGGFNLTTALHAQDSTFGPEYVTDVEAGIKADWQLWSISARSNLDVFHSDYTDIQRTIVANLNNISAPLTENVAGATINGIELEQLFNVTARSEVSLSYSYLESRYDHFFSALSGDLTGRPFPYTPRNKVSV